MNSDDHSDNVYFEVCLQKSERESSRCVEMKVLYSDVIVNEFELQLR